MKKHLLTLITLVMSVGLSGCSDSASDEPTNSSDSSYQTNAPDHYTIFPDTYDISFMLSDFLLEDVKRITPSDQEAQEAETLLKNHLKDNPDLLAFKEYKIQFFGYMSTLGERHLIANFFCSDFNVNWQKDIVYVDDGGNCYFQVRVNLDQQQVFDIMINGEA